MKLGLLIDMDGVIYRGSTPIPGAVEVINQLVDQKIPFIFLTNNSQKTRRDISHKLNKMGMRVNDGHVFTCAMSTARFLAMQKPHGTAYVIGEGGLTLALHQNGYAIVDDHPDYVVVGEGRLINFEALERATKLIWKGAKLIATNMDSSCPVEDGNIRPGCGAIVRMLEEATGKKALSLGKPSGVMMRLARKELDLRSDETLMIGDTMYTDILGGIEMGYKTALVLSGGTKQEDLRGYSYQPDYILQSIADLGTLIPELVQSGASLRATKEHGAAVALTA